MKTQYFLIAILIFTGFLALAVFVSTLPEPRLPAPTTGEGEAKGPRKPYRPSRITADHPRIFFNKRQLRGERGVWRRIAPGGPAAAEFARIRQWCETNLTEKFRIQDDYNPAMRLFAFASAMLPDDSRYGRKAIEIATDLINDDQARNPDFDLSRFTVSLSLVFDWCYEHLRTEERDLLANDLVKRGTYLREVRHRGPPELHQRIDTYLAVGYVGLAVWGEPGLTHTAKVFTGALRQGLADSFIQQREEAHVGGAFAGRSKVEAANAEALVLAILAWRTATEEDFFHMVLFDKKRKPYRGANYLRTLPDYFYYATRPDGRGPKLAGDGVRLPAFGPEALYVLAGAYSNRSALELADRLVENAPKSRWKKTWMSRAKQFPMWRIIARPDAGAIAAAKTHMPGFRFFDKNKVAFYCSDFDKADAVHLGLITGNPRAKRRARAAGHFELQRGEDSLLVSSGLPEKDTPHAQFFRGRRFAYNLVVPVFDEREIALGPFRTIDLAKQREDVAVARPRVEYKGGCFFARVRYDLSLDRRYVLTNRRTLLALGGQAVILYDQARTARATIGKKLALHMNAKCRFVGSENLFAGTEESGIAVSGDATAALAKIGNSALYAEFLLPRRRVIRRVGGADFAFRIGQNDYRPGRLADPEMTAIHDLGLWRLEIEDSSRSTVSEFLVVLAPRPADYRLSLKSALHSEPGRHVLRLSDGPFRCEIELDRATGAAVVRRDEGEVSLGAPRKP